MAAIKPSAAKKKAAPKKATSTKKPATKKTTRTKKAANLEVRSFRLCREPDAFITLRPTVQTIYWSILGIVLLAVGLLILQAQLSILETLNQISEGV